MALANVNTDDPRVKRTRKLLQDAFMELLQDKGFQAVTVQDISQRSTVNRATFYTHYENKYDLAEDLVRQQFNERLAQSVSTRSPVTEDSLRALFRSVLSFVSEVYGHCGLDRQFEPLLERAMYAALHEFALEWLNGQMTNGDRARAEISACVMSAALIGVAVKSGSGGTDGRMAPDEFVRQVVRALGHGVIGDSVTVFSARPAP